MWKDWGLAATLRRQANGFLQLAKQTRNANEQEAYVRASMVFSVMSFEAFFFREVVKSYIQKNAATLDAANVAKVEGGLNGPHFTGIKKAMKKWPILLGLKPLNSASTEYLDKLLGYRNALAHGNITRSLGEGGLAQDVETTHDAEIALKKVGELIKEVAQHFGFTPPPWV